MPRSKSAVAAFAIIGTLLLGGLTAVSLSLRQERAARQAADLARVQALQDKQRAEDETARERQIARFLEETLRGASPAAARGRDTALLEEILRKAGDRVGRDLASQPAVQIELWNTLGGILNQLSLYAGAEPLYRNALDRQRQLDGGESLATAHAKMNLAQALDGLGRMSDAEALTREALAFLRESPGNDLEVANALHLLGHQLSQKGKVAEAEAAQREALALRRKILGPDHPDVAQSLGNLATTLSNQQRKSEAEGALRDALAIWRKRLGNDDLTVIRTTGNLGILLADQGNLAEAERIEREVLTSLRKQLPEWHENILTMVHRLALLLLKQNRRDEVAPLLEPLRQVDFGRQPQALTKLQERCETLAKWGLWSEAAADAARWLELEPANHLAYHTLAPLLVAGDQPEPYRALALEIAKRYGTPRNILVADRMAKDCLFLPVPGLDLDQVQTLATFAVTEGTENPVFPLFCSCKALAEYRQKHYPAAMDWAQKALKNPFPYSAAPSYFVLAMSQHSFGNQEGAKECLGKMAELVKNKMPQEQDRNLDNDWRDWILAHALLKEAQAAIEPGRF